MNDDVNNVFFCSEIETTEEEAKDGQNNVNVKPNTETAENSATNQSGVSKKVKILHYLSLWRVDQQ